MTKLTILSSESEAPLLCASYTRISKVRGAQDDPETTSGVRRQAEQNEALAISRGWIVGDVYQDNDITASGRKKRPEFERLLQDLEAGRFQRLIVWHADRLTRIRIDLDRLIDVCNRRNVEIETVRSGKIDLSTPAGRLVARLQQDVAHHELEHAQERIIAKHEQLAQEGKPSGGRRCYGFERDQITAVSAEQQIIRELAERALKGETLNALARDLNERGVPTAHGAAWSAGTIRTILTSGRISGQREVFGKTEDGRRVSRGTRVSKAVWEPIITPAVTDALRAKFYDPARRTTVGESSSPHALIGLLYCHCGTRMYSKGAAHGGAFHCKKCNNTISAKYLVQPIYDAVGCKVRAGELEAALHEQPDTRPLIEELAEIEEQDKFLAVQWAKKKISATAWSTAGAELERQRREAEEKLQAVHKQMGLTYIAGEQDWDNLSDPARRTILSFFLHRIVVHPSRAVRGVFDPTRVEVKWKR